MLILVPKKPNTLLDIVLTTELRHIHLYMLLLLSCSVSNGLLLNKFTWIIFAFDHEIIALVE